VQPGSALRAALAQRALHCLIPRCWRTCCLGTCPGPAKLPTIMHLCICRAHGCGRQLLVPNPSALVVSCQCDSGGCVCFEPSILLGCRDLCVTAGRHPTAGPLVWAGMTAALFPTSGMCCISSATTEWQLWQALWHVHTTGECHQCTDAL
jgi:hypothetical protein